MSQTVVGVGVDAVSLQRWAKVMARTPSIETFVFTDAERTIAASAVAPERAFAVRFAAKEACRKAFKAFIPWKEMEVLEDPGRSPILTVQGRREFRTHVSMALDGDVAVAVVVVEEPASDSTE